MKIRKQIVLLIFLMVILSGEISAQTRLGITGGINNTGIGGDTREDVSYSPAVGFVTGLTVEFNIMKDIKLCFQPRYVQRNGKIGYDVGLEDPVDSFKTKIDYISLPVILKVPALTDITFFNGGIDLSYLMSASREDIEEVSPSRDLKEELNRFDFSFLFGFGLTFPVQKKFVIEVEARYIQSVSNLAKGSSTEESALPLRFRSSGFQFLSNIYYTF